MALIIGIHGLAKKPAPEQLSEWWEAAIREGLRRNKNLLDVNFEYKNIYWASYLHGEDNDPEPYPYPVDFSGQDDGPLKTYDDGWLDTVRATGLDILASALDSIKRRIDIDALADGVLEAKLQDLSRYYEEEGIRNQLRNELKETLVPALEKGTRTMLISHSMGTIIAYDVLRELGISNPTFRLPHLITIGSPLGLPHVVHKIQQEWGTVRTPSIVEKWSNFADRRDPVAADIRLRDDFKANSRDIRARDDLVINDYGGIHHKSYGYLRAPEVTEAIARFI